MLRGLILRDMLLVDQLELDFQPGLNVLTGETGAGKSILLDCLGFVLGWRTRADVVRAGAERGEVEAIFELPEGHPAMAVLTAAGIDAGAGSPTKGEAAPGFELVLRREARTDGRRTAWVNDRRVTVETLRALGETLVELHGQHDDRGLLNPRGHRAILDTFAGNAPILAGVRAAWSAAADARRARAEAEERLKELAREEDFLRHAVIELTALAPEPGEAEALDARRRLLQAGQRLTGDIARAGKALGEEGAERPLLDAIRWLEDAAEGVEGRLDGALDALNRAVDALAEAQIEVDGCLESLDADPSELERAEERLFAIRGLARKHGVVPDELNSLNTELAARLAALDAGAGNLGALARTADAARLAHHDACARLSAIRAEAAGRLDVAVSVELAPLKMERAVFRTRLAPAEPGPEGAETVTFEVATNPGAPPGALNRIASGGELSRFLLALKVCLSAGGQVMIFDEIDRGVGGATADAVGRRLSRLAGEGRGGGQLLVVTHSPQVAALGTHHFRVEKQMIGAETFSRVVQLSAEERLDEIARMLAGDTITPAARAAARELIDR